MATTTDTRHAGRPIAMVPEDLDLFVNVTGMVGDNRVEVGLI